MEKVNKLPASDKKQRCQRDSWGQQAVPGAPQAHRCPYPQTLVPGLGFEQGELTLVPGLAACWVNPHEPSKIQAERGAGRVVRPLLLPAPTPPEKKMAEGDLRETLRSSVSLGLSCPFPLYSFEATPVAASPAQSLAQCVRKAS